jgi:hypothetical protein
MTCNEHLELTQKIDKINQEYIKFTVQKTLENGYRDKIIEDIIERIQKIDQETITNLKETKNHWNNRIETFIDRILGGILLTITFEILTKIIIH